MENKTTTELLDLLFKLEKQSEKEDGNKFDWDKFEDVCAELRKRYPFSEILGTKWQRRIIEIT